MSRSGRMWFGAAVVAFLMAPRPSQAQSAIVLPRPGQVGVSLQGGYGMLLDSGNVGGTFESGPTFAVRLRYRMRYERGLGLSFESQRYDPRVAPGTYVIGDESTVAPSKLSLVASGVELYQMFNTRTSTVKMLMVGAGLAQMRADLNTGETALAGEHSGDGAYVSVGAGVERFFFRSWAFDLSARYLAVFRDGKANHDVQVALGAIFYAGY